MTRRVNNSIKTIESLKKEHLRLKDKNRDIEEEEMRLFVENLYAFADNQNQLSEQRYEAMKLFIEWKSFYNKNFNKRCKLFLIG